MALKWKKIDHFKDFVVVIVFVCMCWAGAGGGGGGEVRRKPSLQHLTLGCQISFSYVSASFPSSF